MNYTRIQDVVDYERVKLRSKHASAPPNDLLSSRGICRFAINVSTQTGTLMKDLRDLDELVRDCRDDAARALRLAILRDAVEVAGWMARLVEHVGESHMLEPEFAAAIGELAAVWAKRHDALPAWDLDYFEKIMSLFNKRTR